MGLLGIILGLAVLVGLSFRSWSVLVLAPLAAMVAAFAAGDPLLAHWTQTFMGAAAGFVAQFFPLFLLGAIFGKLMEDSGSVNTIAAFMTEKLGEKRAILAVVLAGAIVTYGGVSLFVALFVIVPMAQGLFRSANIPNRLTPGAVALGTMTFTMSAMPGTPAVQNAIPMPFFGTTPFAAPGLGIIASFIMFGFGLWWLMRAERAARLAGEGFGDVLRTVESASENTVVRERATTSSTFDPAEIKHGHQSLEQPGVLVAALPLIIVVLVNLTMSMLVIPRLDTSFLYEPQWGGITIASVSGIWSVMVALIVAILVLIALNRKRLSELRASVDAGANASVLPIVSVASLVGFGAVVAALPAFAAVADWVLSIEGGPLVSLAVSTNVLAALTGSASGGMTIALEALGPIYLQIASQQGIDPALLHRIAVMSAGTLDSLPHNGAVITLLAVCGSTHRKSYIDIVMCCVVSAMLALIAVIILGGMFGSF
ncbi:MAG: GntP family permease [Candidatus Dechloromonas phosphoritropha]|nr:GntP family permease [Candidatus Dechloromonas phosphoritropha]MBP8786231.1 GntP family permease [Azonexus sp.]MBP9226589.1 GntP family permease [Azonexus sp.]